MRTGHRIESAAAVVAAVVVVHVVFLRFQLGAAKLIILNIPRRFKKKLWKAGIACWKSAGLAIERFRVRIPAGETGEFSSPELTLCAVLTLSRCLFHPRVTAVARK